MLLLAAGFAGGLAGAFAIRRAMQAQLYGIGAMDPAVLGGLAAVLVVIAFVACTIPARRAATIDPVIALTEQ
jgi:putative ABC transport system permease protein